MQILRTCTLVAILTATLTSTAFAWPPYGYGPSYGYGSYGPRVFAPYRRGFGYRGFDPRVSYGTGYHGRGTLTGGPVGGLPNRN